MGVCRVAVCGKLANSNEVRNIFTIYNAGGAYPASSAVSAWITAMYTTTNLMGRQSNRLTFDRFIVENVNSAGKWNYQYETPLALAGVVSGDCLPDQCAAVVIGVTASRRRGKKFIAGVAEANAANSGLVSDYIPVLQAFGAAWISGFMDGAAQWLSGVCKANGDDFQQFTSYRVDALVGTQRRRKPGVGS